MSWFRRSSAQSVYEIDDAVLTLTEKDTARLEWPMVRLGGRVFWVLTALVLVTFAGRLVYLNFVKGAEFRSMAEHNSLRSQILVAPRGIIFDRSGEPLVHNEPSFDAVVIPSDLPRSKDERLGVLQALRDFFQPDPAVWEALEPRLAEMNSEPLLLVSNLDQERTIRFLADQQRFPGVTLIKSAERRYVDGPVFAHVLGYEGKIQPSEYAALKNSGYLLTDSIGKQGVERSYETELRGVHGKQLIEVNALGEVKQELGVIPPVKGNDLVLTLDAGLQREAYTVLERVLSDAHLEKGALIALDPRSGAVRAMVSYPSYDNNLFAGGINGEEYSRLIQDARKPLFNRAIAGEYPPGSTIKPLLAAAALTEGTIRPETTIESRGGIHVGRFYFGDWKAHGFTDLRRAIAVSSDVYFYSVGGGYGSVRGLGMARMREYEERFGWGSPTGIDLPGEQEGFLPSPEWKQQHFGERWYIGDDYNASIGQGYVTATPLQILNTTAAIANGGTLYVPRVVEKIVKQDGSIQTLPPHVLRSSIVPEQYLQVVREGMRETVTAGTAQPLQDLPVAVAGKTGTAQFGGAKQTYGWFTSFAPYGQPELAVIVLVEDQTEHATYFAVPITKALYQYYFEREKSASNKP